MIAEPSKLRLPGRGRRSAAPGGACIHHLFEGQAEAAPEREALVCGEERLSYEQLNCRANGIARRLRSLGAGPETIVAILMERSAAMVAAILGVLKAGAAYLPLDPSYPWQRLAFMLADSGTAILLTERAMAGVIPGAAVRPFAILSLDEDGGIAQAETRNLAAAVRPSQLAYVIYTSGSTGQPKAVAVEHRNTVALIGWADGVYGASELGGVFAGVSICFDPSVLDLFVPLCLGGRVIIGANTLALPRAAAKEEVRLINTVPSVMQELLRIGGLPASLETVNLGGEPLSTALVERIYELGHVRRVYDLYGPTECSTCSTFALRRPGQPATIGRPIAQTQIHLLGPDLRPVPPGETGEVFIGGAGVARGYINRPELTAEKFLHLSLGKGPSLRVYRTGDLCRANPDGDLEYLGRKDQQVKVRGFRVELGEVESAVLAHPGVAGATVVAHEDPPGERRLVAYIAPRSGSSSPNGVISSLRSHLESRLPPYMVPANFVLLDRFALTPNGKLDRRALPPPTPARNGAGEFRRPDGGTEELLSGIWKSFLSLEKIGADDDFFHLGGDSLAFAVMLSRVEERTGVKLPLGSILQARTIRRLAGFIDKTANRPAPPPAAAPDHRWFEIQTRGARPPLYLVHGLGGGMLWGYVTLGRHLGEDRPIYAIRRRPPERGAGPETIGQIAAGYAAELLARQPEGPYLLGGYCFGGNVAFEMARQLEAAGRRVDLVVLMNSVPHNSSYQRFRWSPLHAGKFLVNFGRWVHGYSQLNRLRRRQFVRWKMEVLKRRTEGWFGRKGGRDGPAGCGDRIDLSAIPEEERFLWESHVAALAAHRTGPYGGKVLLFRARAHPLISSYDPQNGWGEFVRGGLTVRLVPSLHETLLEEPYVRAMARELKQRLDALEAADRAPAAVAGP